MIVLIYFINSPHDVTVCINCWFINKPVNNMTVTAVMKQLWRQNDNTCGLFNHAKPESFILFRYNSLSITHVLCAWKHGFAPSSEIWVIYSCLPCLRYCPAPLRGGCLYQYHVTGSNICKLAFSCEVTRSYNLWPSVISRQPCAWLSLIVLCVIVCIHHYDIIPRSNDNGLFIKFGWPTFR